MNRPPPASTDAPLVVDLDGTLIRSDLLIETASRFLTTCPLRAPRMLVWLTQGRCRLKERLATTAGIDAPGLPYNEPLLDWLRVQRAAGRRLVLATASNEALGQQVADHLGLFDEVLGSTTAVNLKARHKRDRLVERFGQGGFDYVGNDWADIPVWQAAAQAHLVGGAPRLVDAVRELGNLGQHFTERGPSVVRSVLKAMRPHQWMKNLLILVPLFAAHRYGDMASVLASVLAFIAFSLTASSVYLLNDIADVDDDRHHKRKRLRPFAAGHLGLMQGWLIWPLLLLLAFGLSTATLPWAFTGVLAAYLVLTVAYSLRLKQSALVDVLLLAVLYTVRIVAGAAAVGVPLSFWLLTFSMFLFLSLAFIKRFSELKAAHDAGQRGSIRGRGYYPEDFAMVASLGAAAGQIAVLVLALYIQDSHTAVLYREPKLIWLACPLLLYWISRAWMIAHRGWMHDDPIVFAIKDRTSWLVMAGFVAVFWLARVL